MNLDDTQAIADLDSDNMLARIGELPKQCSAAWEDAQTLELPPSHSDVEHLVIVGMGGSAIGGALLRGLISGRSDVAVTVVRDYELPAFATRPKALVVACSYSGNTEETLSCFTQALQADTRTLAITTGGKLKSLATEAGAPVIQFNYQSQPRAALGYSFVLLLGAVHRLGLVSDFGDDIAEAVAVMEEWQEEINARTPAFRNEAKQLATRLKGQLPVVYGAGFLAAVANRWKTQFNENAKSWAFFDRLPELNHNAVVGLGIPPSVTERAAVVLLRSPLDPDRIAERWDVTGEVLKREGVTAHHIWGRGESRLAQLLSLIHFGDYVSFYMAILNEIDPTPVDTIAFLKSRLAELGAVVD